MAIIIYANNIRKIWFYGLCVSFFYLYGFKTISPDTKIISGSEESKILLTYENLIRD